MQTLREKVRKTREGKQMSCTVHPIVDVTNPDKPVCMLCGSEVKVDKW